MSIDPGWSASSLKKLTIADLKRIQRRCLCASGPPTPPRSGGRPKPRPGARGGPTKASLVDQIITLGDTRARSTLMRMTADRLRDLLQSLELGDPAWVSPRVSEEEDEDDKWRKANPGRKDKGGLDAGARVMDVIERYEKMLGVAPSSPPKKPSPKKPSPKKPSPKKPSPKKPSPKKPSPEKVIHLVMRRKGQPVPRFDA